MVPIIQPGTFLCCRQLRPLWRNGMGVRQCVCVCATPDETFKCRNMCHRSHVVNEKLEIEWVYATKTWRYVTGFIKIYSRSSLFFFGFACIFHIFHLSSSSDHFVGPTHCGRQQFCSETEWKAVKCQDDFIDRVIKLVCFVQRDVIPYTVVLKYLQFCSQAQFISSYSHSHSALCNLSPSLHSWIEVEAGDSLPSAPWCKKTCCRRVERKSFNLENPWKSGFHSAYDL